MDLFIPEDLKKISNILNSNGFECYLVGGAIRNQLLGKEAKDFDLTTNAKPQEVMKLFKRVIPTGIKHGTVTIMIGSNGYEITTYRIDGKYSDGRRPDKIQFTPSIDEDLTRRDFTINSIAYNLDSNEILDINGGIKDLDKSIIRAIGEPSKRFDEDALRLVRACRFASQLDFDIEESTYMAMGKTLGKLKDVSKERISEELLKILKSHYPSIAFLHFLNCGMLEILFPEIYNVAKTNPRSFSNALVDIDNIKTELQYIKFARILSIVDESLHLKILKELKLSNNFIKLSLHILNFIDYDINSINSDYDVRTFISKVGIESLKDLKTIWLGMSSVNRADLDNLYKRINKEIEEEHPFKILDLAISGNDLIKELKIKPGPNIGLVLSALLNLTLELPKLNSKEKLISCAKDIIKTLN